MNTATAYPAAGVTADTARRLVAGDQTALLPLHEAVLAEFEHGSGRSLCDAVSQFDMLETTRAVRRSLIAQEIDFIETCPVPGAGRFAPWERDPTSVRIATAHLVAVMMACAYDEVRFLEVNALRSCTSTAA
mgnify:CR=1 FL=1